MWYIAAAGRTKYVLWEKQYGKWTRIKSNPVKKSTAAGVFVPWLTHPLLVRGETRNQAVVAHAAYSMGEQRNACEYHEISAAE